MARAVYADFQAEVGLCKKGEVSEKQYSSAGTAKSPQRACAVAPRLGISLTVKGAHSGKQELT